MLNHTERIVLELFNKNSSFSGKKIIKQQHVSPFIARMLSLYLENKDYCRPQIVYHWTQSDKFPSIIKNNFQPPNKTHPAKKLLYGSGIYMTHGFKNKANVDGIYGKGTQHCFLSLSLPGRQYNAMAGLDADKPLVRGFHSHLAKSENSYEDILVFFSSCQLLPCFLIDNDEHEIEKNILIKIIENLLNIIPTLNPNLQAPPLSATGVPLFYGKYKKGNRIKINNNARYDQGKEAIIHSLYLNLADKMWVTAWKQPKRPGELLARYSVDWITVIEENKEPLYKPFTFSETLRYKKITIKPDLKLPIGIMGPLNIQDKLKNNPVPVIIALPGGYMDHVSEFYKALCPENHNCLVIVPFLPENESISFFMSGEQIVFKKLTNYLMSQYPVLNNKFHLVGRCNGAATILHYAIENPSLIQSLTIITGGFAGQGHEKIKRLNGIPITFYEPGYNENTHQPADTTKKLFDAVNHSPKPQLIMHEEATARDIDRYIDIHKFWNIIKQW